MYLDICYMFYHRIGDRNTSHCQIKSKSNSIALTLKGIWKAIQVKPGAKLDQRIR